LIAVNEIQEIKSVYHDEALYDYYEEVKQWIQKIDDKEPGAQWTIEDMKKTITINK
jgi:hypothetical protein